MTEEHAIKQMEAAISDITKATVKAAPPGLDAAKLKALARDRLHYALDLLLQIKREHALKQFEIKAQYERRMREAQDEMTEALIALDRESDAKAKPAVDMVDLVERMLG